MAAYAATVALATPKISKLGVGIALLAGRITLSNYNTTHAEITGITGKFKSAVAPTVILDGISSNGYPVAWNPTTKAVKAFYPSKALTAHSHTLHFQTSAAANAVTAAANQLRTAAAAFDVAGVADSAGGGGVGYGDR